MTTIQIATALTFGFGLLTPQLASSANCPTPPYYAACGVLACKGDDTQPSWTYYSGKACTDVGGQPSTCNGHSADCPLACSVPPIKNSAALGKNPYSPRADHSYRHGAIATRAAHAKMIAWMKSQVSANALPLCTRVLAYGGGTETIGVTAGSPKVYLVVYGSQWGNASTDSDGNSTFSADSAGAVTRLQSMFKGLGTGGELWSGIMTQYCDGGSLHTGATTCTPDANHVGYPTTRVLAGVWYDNSSASPTLATAAQLFQEAVSAAAHFGNTTPAANRLAQYVILSPPGTHPDGFNTPGSPFCAWHSYASDVGTGGAPPPSPYGNIALTNMPYVPDAGTECGANFVNGANGALDGVTMVEAHEYAETLTDQLPGTGWTNQSGYASAVGTEVGDECQWITTGDAPAANVVMGNGTYAMPSLWSNDSGHCVISHAIVLPPPTCQDVTVPDVTDGSPDGAEHVLTSVGLVPVPHGTGTNPWVYRQSPLANACIKAGSKVNIYIKSGPVN